MSEEDSKSVLVRLLEHGDARCSFKLMQPASTMSPRRVII